MIELGHKRESNTSSFYLADRVHIFFRYHFISPELNKVSEKVFFLLQPNILDFDRSVHGHARLLKVEWFKLTSYFTSLTCPAALQQCQAIVAA